MPLGNGLAGPSHPYPAVPPFPYVPPGLWQVFCVAANIFYINILMSSFLIALSSAQLACKRNLSTFFFFGGGEFVMDRSAFGAVCGTPARPAVGPKLLVRLTHPPKPPYAGLAGHIPL